MIRMTPIGPGWRTGALAGLVALGLAAGAAGHTRDDFANACSPLIMLSTMTPPPGERGNVVRRLQTIAAGIAESNADLIVSAYADGARIENFPKALRQRVSAGMPGSGRGRLVSKDELRDIYQAYFKDFPESAIVFTQVRVSVKGVRASASAHARFVLPPGSGRDTHNATVIWTLARQDDGWRITEERYHE
mgnify:FL=1